MTLELTPELEARLERKAQERGLSKEEWISRALNWLALSDDEREELEDEEDAREAEWRRNNPEPGPTYTLDDLRRHLGR